MAETEAACTGRIFYLFQTCFQITDSLKQKLHTFNTLSFTVSPFPLF